MALTESNAGQRAKILAEALPYIRRFYGKLNHYTRDMQRWLCAG